MVPELLTLVSFIAIFAIVLLVAEWMRSRDHEQKPTAHELPLVSDEGRSTGLRRSVLTALASIIPQSDRQIDSIGRELRRAGHYRATSILEFLAFRNVLATAMLLFFGTCAVLADPGTRIPVAMAATGVVASLLMYGLPRLLLHQQATRRVARIESGLPDALDLTSMCLSGGLTLSDSFERVGSELSESHPDVAVEFEIVRRQSEADSMGAALRNFADRIDTPDTRVLAAMVSQTEKLGTSVSAAVCDFSDSVRTAQRQRAEEHASKTSIRLLFPVVLCLAPPIFILLCGPPVLKLTEFVRNAHSPGGPLDPGALSSPDPIEFDDPYLGMPTERIGPPSDDGPRFRASATPENE